MIVTMLIFEVFIWIFFAYFIDILPVWVGVLCCAVWFICHFIAFASEDKLRDRIKDLENEVENLKKGGR